MQDGVLKSSNAGVNNSDAAITFTFKKTAKLSFAYKASCEGGYGTSWWDYLDIRVKKAGAASYTSIKQDGSKTVTEFTDYAVELEAGDTLQLAYKKDSSTNGGEDCVYLKTSPSPFRTRSSSTPTTARTRPVSRASSVRLT